jgi:hypothetical protein
MHVNKVSRVRTIGRVAKDLREDVDFLFDVAIEMEPEDGLIWVLSLGDESVMAFTRRRRQPRRADQDPPGNVAARGVLISAPSASPCGLCRTVSAPVKLAKDSR